MKTLLYTYIISLTAIILPSTKLLITTNTQTMAGYYNVEVMDINPEDASVKLLVEMFNPDGSKIYESVGFGLLLLHSDNWKGSLLSSEVNIDNMLDPDWATQYANGFVKKVDKQTQKSSKLPTALLTIYCTDKAWIDHLSIGDKWESYAYEVSRYYEDCDPITYTPAEPLLDEELDSSEYWMPVPSLYFPQQSFPLPKTVYIPRYTINSYVVDTVITISDEDLHEAKKYHGMYVMDIENDDAGLLVYNGGVVYLTPISYLQQLFQRHQILLFYYQ